MDNIFNKVKLIKEIIKDLTDEEKLLVIQILKSLYEADLL